MAIISGPALAQNAQAPSVPSPPFSFRPEATNGPVQAPPSLPGPTTLPPGQSSGPTLPSTADAPLNDLPGTGDAAYGAYQRGRFLTAFREATARVEKDPTDAVAMALLGELHAQGAGATQDAAKAADWYRLATDRGDINSTFRLAMALLRGEGVRKDETRGRALLTRAAEAGQPLAAYNLGLLLLSSDASTDAVKAVAMIRKASDADMPEAQYTLGVLLREGRGTAVDKVAAADLFTRAARFGDIPAEVELAIMRFNGDGIPKDEAGATQGFRRAAFRGNAIAQNRLARLYAAGRGVTRDPIEAAAWHLTAAGQGLADAWLDGALASLTLEERRRAEALALSRLPV